MIKKMLTKRNEFSLAIFLYVKVITFVIISRDLIRERIDTYVRMDFNMLSFIVVYDSK